LWEKASVEPAMLRVPIVIIVFVVLVGISLFVLEKMRIDYGFVLTTRTAPFAFIFGAALLLSVEYALSMTIFSTSLGFTIETGVSVFYALLVLIVFLPLPFAETRTGFLKLLKACFFPVGSVSFSEVLLADAMTSVSKVLKDFGTSIVVVYAYYRAQDVVDLHNYAMIMIALLASLPYWLRVRQCTVQLYGCADFPARVPVLLNIIKYCTAFPPIWLTAYASLGYVLPAMPKLIAAFATLNSLYSFLWDIIMDWGFFTVTREGKILARPRIMLPLLTYLLATVINLALRFAWLINRVPGMDKVHSSVIVLAIELGEVFRRSMWMVYRIEWEVIVQQDKAIEKDPVLADKLRINKNSKPVCCSPCINSTSSISNSSSSSSNSNNS